MECPRCAETPSAKRRSDTDFCAEHALAALEHVGRRLADSRALLESAIERARVLTTA